MSATVEILVRVDGTEISYTQPLRYIEPEGQVADDDIEMTVREMVRPALAFFRKSRLVRTW